MNKRIVFHSVEIFVIVMGWIAWLFRPEAVVAISLGMGISAGVALPFLVSQIKMAIFVKRHKRELLNKLIEAYEKDTGKKLTPEEIEDFEME